MWRVSRWSPSHSQQDKHWSSLNRLLRLTNVSPSPASPKHSSPTSPHSRWKEASACCPRPVDAAAFGPAAPTRLSWETG